jgi:hypothetical protein
MLSRSSLDCAAGLVDGPFYKLLQSCQTEAPPAL